MAEFKFLGYLAEVAGGRTREVVLEKPVPLREILSMPLPEEKIIILIDGKVGHPDSMIRNEDSVVIMPMISGG